MVTMTHIAEKVGVSRATVSLILNGHESTIRFSEDTRRRVLEVAQQEGFRRNELLRSAVSGKNRMIGFLVQSPRSEFVARILDGALAAAEEPGYTIKIMRLPGKQFDHAVTERCIELRLAGVIALHLPLSSLEQLHHELELHRIPLAVLDTHVPLNWGICLESDDAQAMCLAVDHLMKLGHKNIALVSGIPGQAMSLQRDGAFQAAIKKHKLGSGRIIYGHLDAARTVEATRELLQGPAAPTAIIGITDAVALGVYRAARLAKLDVPVDLSVMGYGGMSLTESVDPPLTTVAQPFKQIGEAAVERLLERVHAGKGTFDDTPHQTLLPARLIERESTAAAKSF